MAKAKCLPSGSWRVNLYIGKDATGKRQYKSFTDPDKKTAEFMAAEYALTKKEKTAPLNMTVGEAIDRYIDNKTNVLSPSTVDGYKVIRRNAFKELMPLKLFNLTSEDIQNAVNVESATHKPKTVFNRVALLTSALAEHYPEFIPRIKLPKKQKQEIMIPEMDSVVSLLTAASGTAIEIPIVLASCLGLRRSEICALNWNDYDAKQQTLRVNKAIVLDENNQWVVKAPKSYAGTRVLDVPKSVCAVLDTAERVDIESLVPLNPNALSHKFNRMVDKLGGKIRFHDLRHYYASVLLAIGVPDKYAMQRMGHATPNMLKSVYQHTMSAKDKEITDTINQHFDATMQHEKQHDHDFHQ